MSIDAAIAIVWDVLKMGFAPIKRGYGYVTSSKSYAQDLQEEVGNLDYENQRVRNAAEEARNNLHDIYEWVPEFLASAEKALEDAKDLLGGFEAASKTCCRGIIPDPKCRYQFSRKAKSKTDDIRKLIPKCKDKEISFIGPVAYAADLRKEVGNLEREVERVGVLETTAGNNVRNLHGSFQTWKANAEEALKEAQDLLGGFKGTLPDPKCRDQFSTEAKRQIKVIKELAREGSEFKELNHICFTGPAPRNAVQSTATAAATASFFSASVSVKLRDDGVFESRASMIRNIMDALADSSTSVVGVYGMGGVGKSTLLDQVKEILSEERSFDWVAKADVSKNLNIETIQGEIAADLKLTDMESKKFMRDRAELLRNRLKAEEEKKKKVLIILDNLWEGLDLKSVGIPCGHDNKVEGCKLLLTSRDLKILQSEMGCDKAFRLGGLEDEEARALFESTVGDKVQQDEFRRLVNEALQRCAGVPFLIVAMAKRFKYADLSQWKVALRKMEKFKDRKTNESIDYMLRWSYDNLEEEARALLRLCVVYCVSKPSLENLVRYGFGLGLFQEVNSIEDARDSLHSHIRALQDSSLLLPSEEGASGFKIHDLVRDFVASVSSRDHHPLLVLKDKDMPLTDSLKDELKSCEEMCFPNMKELPQELNCPELRVLLLLSTSYGSFDIPDSYFNSMKNLMALHLTGHYHFPCSPSPFQFLANLHTLCFQNCSFEDVAILGNLKGLQILSIVDSKIQRLPKEIGQLVELRSLDLSRCYELEIIEPGALQSLTNLEELYLQSFRQWSAGEQTQPTNASLIELNHMRKLCTLHVSIPDPRVLPDHLNIEKLTEYDILIGEVWWWWGLNGLRKLELKSDRTRDVLRKQYIKSILDKADRLLLDRMDGNEQSICILSQIGFPQLKHLKVKNSPSIRDILQQPSLPAFKALETLFLENMINLEKITSNNISSESFSSLKVVQLKSCDKMKVLFPHSVARELRQLEEIKVESCKLLRGIVEADDDCGKFEWPNLCVLELRDLPNIEKFFTAGLSPSTSTSNNQVGVHIAFFNGQQVALPRLETLKIQGLDNLMFTFSPSMVKSLAQLRNLTARGCKKMEAIIMEEEGVGVKILETLAFPMLTELCLENLQSLGRKCSQESQSQDDVQSHSSALFNRKVAFPKLESLEIAGCDNVAFMFFPSVVKSLAQLRKLRVRSCNKMEAIIMEEEGSRMETSETPAFPMLTDLSLESLKSLTCFSHGSQETRNQGQVKSRSTVLFSQEVAFPKLESLTIDCCRNVEFIFFSSTVKSLAQLRKLSVSSCTKMEAIIMEEEGLRMETSEISEFPMLTDLSLTYLESLTCFFHGSQETRSQDHIKSRFTVLFSQEVDFPKLETLAINGLGKLGFIFFPSMVKSLTQLRKLSIRNCKKMEAIIMEEEGLRMETSETLTFPMLTNLSLRKLESLTCFSHGSQKTRSQDHVKSRSTVLFGQEVNFPRLETLEISGLGNLGFIFFPSMVKSLTQLRKLRVSECKKMEAIITEEEGLRMKTSKTLAFPMLTDLTLQHLESLTCFSHGSRETRSQDRVKSCSTTLFSQEVALPSLEKLYIIGMDNIKKIWDNQAAVDSFPKLKLLCVNGCNKFVTVIPSFTLGWLKSLERLVVEYCGSLEVVFELPPLIPLDGHPVAFPLRELKVSGLPKLTCVWDKQLHHQVKFQRLRSVSVSQCKSLTSLFPASITRDLIQLEKLEIRECGIVELIEKEEGLLVPKFVFPNLTSLELMLLTELKSLYSETHTSHWPALKTLKVDHCCKLEILVSQTKSEIPRHKQSLFLIEKGAFPNLQELKLDLSERVEIWHGNFLDEESFCKLRVLKLHHLSKEYAISTCRFVESLTNLEELVVSESYPEEPTNNVKAIDGPCQVLQVILPFPRRIQRLKILDVSDCDGLSSTFTPTIAENLVALTKLRISNCRTLTEVISDEEFEEERVVTFKQLKYMELEGLIELRCFSSSGYTLVFPLLEEVIVNKCPNMKFFSEGQIEAPKLESVKVSLKERYGPTKSQYFWKGNLNITIQNMYEEMASVAGVRFMRLLEFPKMIEKWHSDLNPLKSSWQLETLVLDKCPSFINAMSSKLMLVLEKMISLQVCDCKSLEEIFDLQGLEAMESTRVLPCLGNLNLINLPKLRQLWNKDLQGTMRFNSLYSLTLYKCSNLRHAFAPSMARCLANLYLMEIRECDRMEGVIEEEEGQGSTVEKITFPKLIRMILKWLPNLTSFLSGKNHALDCPKMESLTIAHGPKMSSLTCQSSMDIDHSTPSLFTPQVQFPRLKQMVLSHMDNLSKIWPDNSLETLSFDSFREVKAKNCESLQNLFPHWVATSLTQLEKLRVESCRIEEIVANGDDGSRSNIAQVLFPKLTSLVLHDMPRLKTFCPNLPTLNWLFLEELRVTHCDKVNMLSFAASMNKWPQRDDQQDLLEQEAQSSFERDFPKSQRLLLDDKNIQMIQDGKYPDDIFGKLKALTLACFHEENAVFPPRFLLKRFQNLESLEVFGNSFEDIFLDERLLDEGKHLMMLESLRELKLSKLHKLKRVWREDYLMVKILQNIRTFEVCDCPCLTTLFPAAASLENLTKLVVKNSFGLIHLGTASAMASLVHLEEMTIIGCEKMKKIVADDENGGGKVIYFKKLGSLTLKNMPSLECFSSTTSCILRFPSLYNIKVEECPKMKIFSKGKLSIAKLRDATLFRYEYRYGFMLEEWKSDLNRAIRELSP